MSRVKIGLSQQPLATLRLFLCRCVRVDVHVAIGVGGHELYVRLVDEEVRGKHVQLARIATDVGEHAHVFLVTQQSDAFVNVADEDVVLDRRHAVTVDLNVDEGDAFQGIVQVLPNVDLLTDGGDEVTENGIDGGDGTLLLSIVDDLNEYG